MKYFKTTLIIFSLFFNCSYSIGQSFSLPELIRMSKMSVDDFDTYVTSRGFVFKDADKEDHKDGVNYALNLNISNSKASKFIALYQRFFNYRYKISLQTLDKVEYINIKNQIKTLGFKLYDSGIFTSDAGEVSNRFNYSKGKSEISIYASATSFEINYGVKF